MSLKESTKRSRNSHKYLSFGEKIMKIGSVYPEIICLVNKEEIMEGKIFSAVSQFAEWPK